MLRLDRALPGAKIKSGLVIEMDSLELIKPARFGSPQYRREEARGFSWVGRPEDRMVEADRHQIGTFQEQIKLYGFPERQGNSGYAAPSLRKKTAGSGPASSFRTGCPKGNARCAQHAGLQDRNNGDAQSVQCLGQMLSAPASAKARGGSVRDGLEMGSYHATARQKPARRGTMKLHGTINSNLSDAIASAERLKGKPVYPETLTHWIELLFEARRIRGVQQDFQRSPLDGLIDRL